MSASPNRTSALPLSLSSPDDRPERDDGYAHRLQAKEERAKKEALYLSTQRPTYEPSSRKMPKSGWNITTQVCNRSNSRMFDGMQARPYLHQLQGTLMARAKSGPRSVASWQRDYNTKGNIDEKCMTLRFQRVLKMKQDALKEAKRRNVPAEVVEEEMYQALRARSHRIDTNLRKCELHAPTRAVPVNGGPPKLFDGSERLEENFSFKDARDMFRGDAWEGMAEALAKANDFKPPSRSLEAGSPRTAKSERQFRGATRGSFSAGVTPDALAAAQQQMVKSPSKRLKDEKVAEQLNKFKSSLARKYGSLSAAWRNLMDPNHHGKLSFVEWSKVLRQHGFEGDIKAAYRLVDDDNSGIVTFSEFAPEVAPKIMDFRKKLINAYGPDMDAMWKSVDDNGNNQLDMEEFSSLCFIIGYNTHHQEMFAQLRYHPSRKFLTLEDFKTIPIVL